MCGSHSGKVGIPTGLEFLAARKIHTSVNRASVWLLATFSHNIMFNVLVLLAVVGEDEVLELHLDLHPLLVRQRRPDVVHLGDRRLVRLQDDLRAVVVHVQRAQDQDQPRKRLKKQSKVTSIALPACDIHCDTEWRDQPGKRPKEGVAKLRQKKIIRHYQRGINHKNAWKRNDNKVTPSGVWHPLWE